MKKMFELQNVVNKIQICPNHIVTMATNLLESPPGQGANRGLHIADSSHMGLEITDSTHVDTVCDVH